MPVSTGLKGHDDETLYSSVCVSRDFGLGLTKEQPPILYENLANENVSCMARAFGSIVFLNLGFSRNRLRLFAIINKYLNPTRSVHLEP